MQDFIQLQQGWGGRAGREISMIELKEVSIFHRIQHFPENLLKTSQVKLEQQLLLFHFKKVQKENFK